MNINPATYGTPPQIVTMYAPPFSSNTGTLSNSVAPVVQTMQPMGEKSSNPARIAAWIVTGAIGLLALMYLLPVAGIQLQF